MRQCQGGWCMVREKCAHYYAEATPWLPAAERLCEKGSESPIRQFTVKEWARPEVPAINSVWDLAR